MRPDMKFRKDDTNVLNIMNWHLLGLHSEQQQINQQTFNLTFLDTNIDTSHISAFSLPQLHAVCRLYPLPQCDIYSCA